MNIESEYIYLDYAATTPMSKNVYDKMVPYFLNNFGNPSSVHKYGQKAEQAIENAREITSSILNCDSDEIIFTSGGSESNNMAIRGIAEAIKQKNRKNHILTSPLEHDSVSKTVEQLGKKYDFKVEFLPVDKYGRIIPSEIKKRIIPETALVTVIYANNEIGTLNNIQEIGQICNENEILFHSDALQAAAFQSLDVKELNVDALSIGAHKFYGPKGVGVLYLKKGTPFISHYTGGSQEGNHRAGTSNVPYIVGQADALSTANVKKSSWTKQLTKYRDYIFENVIDNIPKSRVTGHPQERLPNHASFIFQGVNGNELIMQLDNAGFACSSGSACKTGNPAPSSVLTALNIDPEWGLGSLRVSLGQHTTMDQIDKFLAVLPGIIRKNRKLNGFAFE